VSPDPPQQLPPPGWHPDPHGAGVRWWDGQRWTEHMAASPEPGPELPEPDPGPPEARRLLPWIGAAAIVIAGAIGAFALSSGGGDSETAGGDCGQIAQSLAADLLVLEGTGVPEGAAGGEGASSTAQLDYEELSEESLDDRCGPAAKPLEVAVDEYLRAAKGGPSQAVRARQALTIAQRELLSQAEDPAAAAADLQDTESTSFDERAQERAHTAQVAIETFATGHGGTYIGATPQELAQIEPVLLTIPLQVTELSEDSYTLEIRSESGNVFILAKKGDAVTTSCTEEGTGGCPAGGAWD
jgi:hypothetical protein